MYSHLSWHRYSAPCMHVGWIINKVLYLWERWFAASSANVILFPRHSSDEYVYLFVVQAVCESPLIIQLHSCMLNKDEILHLWERWFAASSANVILFIGTHPTSMLHVTSSVGQAVFESALIVQPHTCTLDKVPYLLYLANSALSFFFFFKIAPKMLGKIASQ